MAPDARSQRRPATDRLARALLASLHEHAGELHDGPLIVAVSGGADSLALLVGLNSIRHTNDRDLVVAHFSHGIRKTAEKREATMVKRVAKDLGLNLVHEQAAVVPTEAAAREARYAFLDRVAAHEHAAAVVTAHTENDQAETVLLRLARGTGMRGVGAIRPVSQRKVDGATMTLLRPMLAVDRDTTEQVCEEHGLRPASDGTNRSLKYARNRVRRRILPELREVNPRANRALARFAETAQADDDLLQSMAAAATTEIAERSDGQVRWPIARLEQLPAPLLIRVLQRGWSELAGEDAALDQDQVESALNLIADPDGGSLDMGQGIRLVVEQGSARLTGTREEAALGTGTLAIPGSLRLGDWTFEASVGAPGIPDSSSPWQATLDLDALGNEVLIRSRQPGDKIHPLGMKEHVSLQDLLVNAKVPRSTRDALPVFVTEQGIAWVAGVRIAEWAKVTRDTTLACTITAKRG